MPSILLVEDDMLLSKAVIQELESTDIEIQLATSASEAMVKLETHNISGILMDIHLVGQVSGLELLKNLKAENSEFKNIPVVMLSNFSSFEEKKLAESFGADDFLDKEKINLGDLAKYIHDFLKEK